ncbi:Patatin phospholipase [uncultured virus]|nr:Patatin phospholipase [uncultured virus]
MERNNEIDLELDSEILEIIKDDINIYEIKEEFDIPIYLSKKIGTKKKILVLSGGGIKGIALLGSLFALEEAQLLNNFEIFAGASVGALTIALFIIGYKPKEIFNFLKSFDLGKLKYINIFNFLQYKGIDNGVRLEYVIRRLIEAKGINPDITLKELYELKKKKIIFSTVCLNTSSVNYLSFETFPNLPLIIAIRMSISIPLFYTPVFYNKNIYIDGGCIDNYPIKLFDHCLDDVLGIYLTDLPNKIDEINDIETYLIKLFDGFMQGMTINAKKGYEKYTISIDLKSVNIINYELSDEQKQELFNKGYNITKSLIIQ